MVEISPCINAHGTLLLASGHFSPLGQYTSFPAPCRLIESLEHGKQNLWCATLGHCTKCVSSRRSWHRVHFSVVGGTGAASLPPAAALSACASLDVTVVEETCRLPDERRPLEEPKRQGKTVNFFLSSFKCSACVRVRWRQATFRARESGWERDSE